MPASSGACCLDAHHCPGSPVDLAPAQPGFVVEISDFLAPHECARLIALAEQAGLTPAPASDRQPKNNEAYLDRDTARVHDGALSAALWQRLAPLLPPLEHAVPVGLHSDGPPKKASDGKIGVPGLLKVYRYTKGHRFGLHVDQSWKSGAPHEETEYTFLVYLNSAGEVAPGAEQPLVGGDTCFMATSKKELARCAPRAGTAVLHAHGRRCLMHEGEEVTRGVKYLLRADVMYRRLPSPAAAADAHAAADALAAVDMTGRAGGSRAAGGKGGGGGKGKRR
jgi:hypothetical protein